MEDLVGERLIMTYLERRLAMVPDDRLGDALSSVAAQEPAVSDLIKKTWVIAAYKARMRTHCFRWQHSKPAQLSA